MKIKHVVTSVALSLALGFGAVAGLMANKEAKAAKAEEPADTWMMNFSLNAKDIIDYTGFDSDSIWLHTYTEGVGNDGWFHMYPIEEGSKYYQVNATFADDYTYNRVQFKFMQGSAEKWSTSYSTGGSKESAFVQVYCSFGGWNGDNWTFSLNTSPNMYVKYNGVNYYFEADVANKRYIARNVVSDESSYLTFYYRQSWDFAWPVLTETSKGATYGSYADNWFNLKSGTYDFVLKNNNEDNGVMEIIEHVAPNESFIYYVLENNNPTNDYIYSWGGNNQFGAWPGTKITEIDGVKEVSGNGVLHFEGSETPKLIYAIPVTIGYPTGDSQFKFNNNNDWESEAREIVGGAAYWYTGAANANAGDAIDFLVRAESIRNSAEDYSVCKISASDAAMLVNLYNDLDEAVRAYVDSSSVYTYKRDGSEGNELVSYRIVAEQLAELANIPLVGSDRYFNSAFESNTMVVVIISIAATSALVFTMLLVFKKKKQK